jgi:hypothetical protein
MRTKKEIDRTGWQAGPWDDEPDVKFWAHQGLECAVARNQFGAWCGYVKVPEDHPWHGLSYSDRDPRSEVGYFERLWLALRGKEPERKMDWEYSLEAKVDVHGGLTYGARGHHMLGDGWWLGFDCAHAGDLAPGMVSYGATWPDERYRDLSYVMDETEKLAKQVAQVK